MSHQSTARVTRMTKLTYAQAADRLQHVGGLASRFEADTISHKGITYSRRFACFLSEGGHAYRPTEDDMAARTWVWEDK